MRLSLYRLSTDLPSCPRERGFGRCDTPELQNTHHVAEGGYNLEAVHLNAELTLTLNEVDSVWTILLKKLPYKCLRCVRPALPLKPAAGVAPPLLPYTHQEEPRPTIPSATFLLENSPATDSLSLTPVLDQMIHGPPCLARPAYRQSR